MVVSELLQNFDARENCEHVELVTNDGDFGCMVTVGIASPEMILNTPELTEMRIAPVKRWWVKKIVENNGYPCACNIRLQLVVQI